MKINSLTAKILILSIPFWMLSLLLFTRLEHFYTYEALGREDNLIENIQVAVFGLTTFVNLIVSFKFWKQNKKFLGLVFTLFALGTFFITMEEISWGQRILNFSTPESLSPNNVQGEANLHNLSQFHYKIYLFNLAAAIYGSFSWVLKLLFSKVKVIGELVKNLTIPWYLATFFPALFINQFFPYFMPQDFESVELIFALGLMIFAITRFKSLQY